MPQYLREPRPDSYKLSGVTRVFVTTSRLTGRICLRENKSDGRGFLLPSLKINLLRARSFIILFIIGLRDTNDNYIGSSIPRNYRRNDRAIEKKFQIRTRENCPLLCTSCYYRVASFYQSSLERTILNCKLSCNEHHYRHLESDRIYSYWKILDLSRSHSFRVIF